MLVVIICKLKQLRDFISPIRTTKLARLWNLMPTKQEGNYTWYLKASQLLRDSKAMNIRKESTTTTLLDELNSLLHSNTYPYIHR